MLIFSQSVNYGIERGKYLDEKFAENDINIVEEPGIDQDIIYFFKKRIYFCTNVLQREH